jgi:hypothetical protein
MKSLLGGAKPMENSLTFTQMYPLKLSKYLSMNQMNMKVGS